MRIYILAGEASGDIHAAGLIRALRRHCVQAEFRGMGGDACRNEGMVLHRHFSEQNYMGFTEILKHLPQIFRNIRETVADIAEYKPQVVIPVDYPGFNFRVMKRVKALGIPVDYFIPPQIWAWRPGRAKTLARYTRNRFVVFPFEPNFYKSHGVDVFFVGNPLVDELQADLAVELRKGELLALLPGSRRLEVEHILPIMVQAALQQALPAVVCAMRHLPDSVYASARQAGISLVFENTRETLKNSAQAWVASGTATLETALLGVPQVVCYKASALSVSIARRLIRVPYISLVNLLLNRSAVTELIQNDLSVENLLQASRLLNGEAKQKLADNYSELLRLLGSSGCFDRAAQRIIADSK